MFFCDKLFGWEQLLTGCSGVLSCVSLRNEMQLVLDRPWWRGLLLMLTDLVDEDISSNAACNDLSVDCKELVDPVSESRENTSRLAVFDRRRRLAHTHIQHARYTKARFPLPELTARLNGPS